MQILSLAINGQPLDSLDAASVKLSVTNVSPISMSGDSVAFSASVKVPRTWNNDKVFNALQFPGVHTANYDADLRVSSLPFRYLAKSDDAPVSFYAKVSMNATDYTLNLIENEPKWSSLEQPLSIFGITNDWRKFVDVGIIERIVHNLEYILQRNFSGFTGTFPPIYPESYGGSTNIVNPQNYTATVATVIKELNWDNICTGTASIVPRNAIKGAGGWQYEPDGARVIINNANLMQKVAHFTPSRAQNIGFNISTGESEFPQFVIRRIDGMSIAQGTQFILQNSDGLQGVPYRMGLGSDFIDGRTAVKITSPLPNVYFMWNVIASHFEIVDTTGFKGYKFLDGYTPEEVCFFGEGNITVNASYRPTVPIQKEATDDFPFTDVKMMVDALCSAFQWRKIFRAGKLELEPIVAAPLRNRETSKFSDNVYDWSDRFVSVDTVSTPDDFGDEYVCKIGDRSFSYSAGKGTVNFVKDAFSSGMPYKGSLGTPAKYPQTCITNAWKDTPMNTYTMQTFYYQYIRRHFRMFDPRAEVKIKARLSYQDVRNLRLDAGYYFKQLGGTYYLKNLGEFDVTKGDCKLTLWKLNLTD